MKNKVLLSVVLLMGIFGAGLNAAAEQSNEPNFDFMNKTGKPVWIAVSGGLEGKVKFTEWIEVKPAKIMPLVDFTMVPNDKSAFIDISQSVFLFVIANGPLEEALKNKGIDYAYIIMPGKKIYVTLHNDGKLIPQTGPGGGKKGIIEAGYSKDNMITQNDIIRVNPKTREQMKNF